MRLEKERRNKTSIHLDHGPSPPSCSDWGRAPEESRCW